MSNSTKTVQRTGKTALVLISVLAVFLLTNCENFMNGNNSFLQNLESQISVANAPVITVRLQPVQNSGTTVPAPGDISFKLNVVKQLEFTVNTDSHVFDHWAAFDKTAYDAGARIELTDTVTFSEAKNPKTTATVIKNIANILIVPVCLPHPVITLKAEAGTGTISPTAPITAKVGSAYDIEFLPNESTYVFDHWAVYDKTEYEAGKKVELADKIEFVNSKNPKTKITVLDYFYNLLIVPVCFEHPILTIETPEETGTITPSGEKILEINEPFTVTMKCASDYYFVEWAAYIVSGETDVPCTTDQLTFTDIITAADNASSSATATLKERRSDIVIRPTVKKRPVITLEAQANTGTLTPSGTRILNLNASLNLNMACSEKYTFLRWAAYIKDSATGLETETTTAVSFTDTIIAKDLLSSSTVLTLKEERSDIVVRPLTLLRPSLTFETMPNSGVITPAGEKLVNLNDPMPVSMTCSNSHGFIRWAAYIKDGETYTETDAVTFSQPVTAPNLASSTVYAALTQNLENVVIRPICAQRPSVRITLPSQGEKNVYRNTAIYIDFTKPLPVNTFDGFNNLTIIGSTNVTSEDPFYESYEKYYEEPVLSQSRQRLILRSATASGNEQLPRYASVSVTISSDVLDDFNIPMGTDYTLTFTAGKDGDTEPPAFEDIIVSRDASSDAFLSESDLNAVPPGLTLNPFIQNRAKNTVYIGIKADAPSPDNTDYITSFTLTETLVYTAESGQIASNKNKLPVSLDPDDNGYVWFTYTIANAANIDSGIVQLQIQATDSNSNITPIEEYSTNKSNSYLIFFDQTPPNVTGTNLTSIPLLAGATAAGWYNGESKKIITIPAAGAGVIKDTEVDSTIRLHSTDVFWQFSLNGTLWTEFTSVQTEASLNVKELFEGEVELENQPIYVRLKDDMGNISAIGTLPNTHSYKVDTKSPPSPVITKADTNPWAFADIPNAKYWIKSAGTISYELTLSGTDTSGIAGYLVDTRTGTPRTGTTLTVGTGGNIETYGLHTIYSVDGAGNISEEGTPFYTFEDVTPPEFTSMKLSTTSAGPAVYPNDTTLDAHNRMYWTQSDTLTFTLGMTDGGSDPSGVYGYATKLDGSDAQAGTTITLGSSDFNNDDPLLTEYTVYAVDNVKNVSTAKTVTIVKDTTAPLLDSLTASGSKGLTHEGIGYVNIADNYKVNAVIDFTEARSGVRDIQFNNTICSSLTDITVRNNGAELVLNTDYEIIGKAIRFTPPLTTASITIEGITVSTGDGEKNLGPALADAVNNQSDKGNLSFKVDTVRPTVDLTATGTTPGINSYWNGVSTYFIRTAGTGSITELTLTPIGSDANGGSILGYKTSTGASPTATVNAGVGNNQTLYSVDLARNDSNPLAFSVVADTTPPEKPVLSTGTRYFIKDGYLYHKSNVSVTYTLTSEDSGSGIYGFTSTGVGTLSGNEFTVDSGSIILTAKDNVGNTATLSLTGVPDTTYPIILDEDGKDTLLKGNKNDGTPPEQTGYSSDNTVDAVIHFSNENNEANSAGVRFIRFLNSGTGEYLKVTDETRVLDGNGNPIDSQIWVNDIELKLTTSIHKSPITVKNLTIANTSGDGFYEPTIHYIADAVENVGAQSIPVEITIDTTPPTIDDPATPEIETPTITQTDTTKLYGTTYHTTENTVVINIPVTDDNKWGYKLGSGGTPVSGSSYTYTTTTSSTPLNFYGVDKAGNESENPGTITVMKDLRKPEISNISLKGENSTEGYLNKQDSGVFTAVMTLTRPDVGIKSISILGDGVPNDGFLPTPFDENTVVKVNGTALQKDSNYKVLLQYNISFTNTLPSGSIVTIEGIKVTESDESKKIKIIAADEIGNQSSMYNLHIERDETVPEINTYSMQGHNGSYYYNTRVIGHERKDTYTTSTENNYSFVTSGSNTVYFTVATVPVDYDSVMVKKGTDETFYRTDTTNPPTKIEFALTGAQSILNIKQRVYICDKAGNISESPVIFTVIKDETRPEITSLGSITNISGVSPAGSVSTTNPHYSKTGSISFTITANDPGTNASGLYGHYVSTTPTNGPISDTDPGQIAGTAVTLTNQEGVTDQTYNVYAVDNVGNLSTPAKTIRVIKDSTAPQKNSGVMTFHETTDTSFTTSIIATKNSSVSIKMTDFTESASGIKVITITGLANTAFTPDIRFGATQVFNTPVTPSGGSVTITLDSPRQIANDTVTITDLPITNVDGGKPITVQFTDAVENTHEDNSKYSGLVYYDVSSPIVTGTTQIDGVTGGFTKNLGGHSFAFTTYDAGSGVKTITLSGADFTSADCTQASSVTGKSATGCTLNFTTPITSETEITVTGITLTTENAENTITASIADALENPVKTTSASITHDSLLSVALTSLVSSVGTDPAGFTGSTSVNLTVTPTADVSGIVSIDFSSCTDVANITSAAVTDGDRDGSKFTFATPITAASPLTITGIAITTTDGEKTIQPLFTDKAGNTFKPTSEGTITYDKVNPSSATIALTGYTGSASGNSISTTLNSVEITAADASSGVSKIVLSGADFRTAATSDAAITDATVTGCTLTFTPSASKTVTLTGVVLTGGQGTNTINATAYDAVNNSLAAAPGTITLDTGLPSATAFTLAGANGGTGYINGSDSLTAKAVITTAADTSGVKKITFSGTDYDSISTSVTVKVGATTLTKEADIGNLGADEFYHSGDTITLFTPLTAISTVEITGIIVDTGDGEKDVDIVLTDLAGNASSAIDGDVYLDTTPPVLTLDGINSASAATALLDSGTYYSSAAAAIFDITLADDTHGSYNSLIQGYKVDTGSIVTGSTAVTLDAETTVTTYTLYAVDNANNLSAGVPVKTMLHTTDPSAVALVLKGNSSGVTGYVNGTDSNEAMIDITFTKETVGVTKIAFSGAGLSSIAGAGVNDGTGDLTLDTDYTITDNIITLLTPLTGTDKTITVSGITVETATGDGDGNKFISIQLTDAIGNTDAIESTGTGTINRDTQPPSITSLKQNGTTSYLSPSTVSDSDTAYTNADSISLTIDAVVDDVADCAGFRVGTSEITEQNHTFSATTGGNTYSLYAVDNAGNVNTAPFTFTLYKDAGAPSITSVSLGTNTSIHPGTEPFDGESYFTKSAELYFTVSMSDPGSNQSDIYGYYVSTTALETNITSVSLTDGNVHEGSTMKLECPTADQAYNYNIYAVDKVGNISNAANPYNITVTQHGTAPSSVTLALTGNGTTGRAGYVNIKDANKANAAIGFTKATVGVTKLAFSGTGFDSIANAGVHDGTTELTLNTHYTINDKTITLLTPVTTGTITVKGVTVKGSDTTDDGDKQIIITLTDAVGNSDLGSTKTENVKRDTIAPAITYSNNPWEDGSNAQFNIDPTEATTDIDKPNAITVQRGTSSWSGNTCNIKGQIAGDGYISITDLAGNVTTMNFKIEFTTSWVWDGTPTYSYSSYRTIPRTAVPTPVTLGTKTGGGKNAQAFVQGYTYLPAAEYVFGSTPQSTDAASAAASKPGTDAAAVVPVSLKQPMQTEQNTLPVNEGISLTSSSGSILFAPEPETPAQNFSSPADIALTNNLYIEETDTKAAVETAFSTPVRSITASEVQEPAPLALVLGLILLLGMGISAAVFAVFMIKKCKKVQ